jgi:hypothetical protein
VITLAEVAAADRCRGFLFVSRQAGSPMGWPLEFKILDNELWATTYRSATKVPRIRAADQACCLLLKAERRPYPYLVLNGQVDIVEPNPELVARYMGWTAGATPDPLPRVADRLLRAKRVFIHLHNVQEPLVFPEPS